MKVSSINDLSKKVFSGCSYRTNKLVPLSGSQTQTLSLTGTVNVQFEIPTQVVNLAKSRLVFDMLIPAVAGNTTWVHADPLSLFSRIQLLTRGGTSLMDITDANKFSNVVSPITTPLKELLQRSSGGSLERDSTTATATVAASAYEPLQGIQTAGLNSTGNLRPSKADGTAGGEVSQVAYLEQRYLFNSATSTAATDIALSYQLALELLEHTILSVNKNMYFGENLILSLTFANSQAFSFSGVFPGTAVPTSAVNAGIPVVSNLALYLKVEQNPVIIRGFQEKLMSPEGLSVVCPYVYTTKVNTGGSATSGSINFRLNRGYGQRLLRVYNTVFNGTEIYSTSFDRSNESITTTGGVPNKISTYRTLLNSVQLLDFQVDCSRSEDWLVNSDLIEGSAVTSVNNYKYNWVHIDDFSGKQSILEEGDAVNDSDICGRDLSEEALYSAVYNLRSGQYNMFSIFVVQRELVIRQGMIQWV